MRPVRLRQTMIQAVFVFLVAVRAQSLESPSPMSTGWLLPVGALALIAISNLIWFGMTRRALQHGRQLRGELERRAAEMSKLARLTEAINEAVTIEEVLDHLYENISGIIPYDRIGLALLDEDRIVLRAVWARGKAEPTGIDRGYEAPLHGSSLQKTLESGKPRIISNLEAYLEEHPESESTRRILREGIRSSLTCPLRALGKPVGFIFFSSFEPETYGEVHSEFLQQIAGHLSLIVGKSKLYDDLLETKQRLEKANEELGRLATVDSLTGVENRRAFDDRIDAEWRRAYRAGEPISLLMIDVDFFKPYNDRYGHKAGDACLEAIAGSLQRSVRRAGDMVARYGGEEFAIILAQCEHEQGMQLADKIRQTVEDLRISHLSSDLCAHVTISVGVATAVPELDQQPDRLIERADIALYEAKRRGRNRIVSWEEMAAEAV